MASPIGIRRAVALALVAFALGVAGYAIWKDANRQREPATGGSKDLKIVVYYFHGTVRCATCDRIEALGKAAVEDGFEADIRRGRIEWRPIDVDRRENAHFVADYSLLTRSIVVADVRPGREKRWKNLDRIWDLLDDKKAFERYVQDEVAAFLGAP